MFLNILISEASYSNCPRTLWLSRVLHWSERLKKRQNKSQQFCPTIHCQCVLKIWRLALIEAEKFVTKILIGEKENGQIKGMISSSTPYKKSYLTFVLTFKILCAVVPEKSLTQMSLCITLEWETDKKTRAGVYETLSPQHMLAPKDNLPKLEKGDNSAKYSQNFAVS